MTLTMALKFFVFVLLVFSVESSRVKRYARDQCGEPLVPEGTVQFGHVSERNKWPYLVALFEVSSKKFFCGGSLISRRHILTAAHCLQPKQATKVLAYNEVIGYLGKYDLNQLLERGSVPVYPNEIHIHPDWKPSVTSFDADIAVITIDEEAPLRHNIFPVCLWTANMRVVKEDEGTVVGW